MNLRVALAARLSGLIFLVPALCFGTLAKGAEPVLVVTGERVQRTAAETPSSLVVITGEELEDAIGSPRLEDILSSLANVRLGSGSEGPTIRGQDGNGPLRDLPAFLSGNRPRVTLQIDGRPVTYNELAYGVTNLWDLERIEVYRSPQTTTQGRNAIAGAIFAYTRAPTFQLEARARGIVGNYDTRQVSATVSGPIIADTVAMRLSADFRTSRPASVITAPGTGISYNRDRYAVVRLKLLATPTALPGLQVSATATHNRSAAPQFEGVREPFKERRDPEATYGFFDVRTNSGVIEGVWDFATGWSAKLTTTGGDALIRRTAPPGFGVTRVTGRDAGTEGVLTWRPAPSLSLLAGANITRSKLEQRIDLRAAQLGRGEFYDRQSSLGLFGQGEWQPVQRLTLTAGVRYQRDGQDRIGTLGAGAGLPQSIDYNQRFERMLPKISASWEVFDGVRGGALVQRAYNPGGVSLDARRRVVQTFGAETLWDYELFLRAAPPGRSFTASINAFYYDQENLQRTLQRQIITPGGVVTIAEVGNALAGYNYGAELEGSWRATPRLTLSSGVGILRTKLTRTLSPTDPLLGNEFQLSPHLTASLAADWRPTNALRFSLRARHHSGYFSDDLNDPARRVAGAEVVDAGANWTHGPLTVSAYLHNALNAFYLTYHSGPGSRLATAGDPREFGLSADMRF
ncbi:TonB-dependent receptor [Tsuneonella deserti]|uniref:TonB-dependent receptor n=1 Tax=Tsuneonella deserti TaxID=2035528 RepID=A0ABQ1S7E3_9SPHN|nr:TonB-dependent receptor [Tsuneonella deserti]GGD96507.1 TonB-dependent receptor [Tsuneonella deserti]